MASLLANLAGSDEAVVAAGAELERTATLTPVAPPPPPSSPRHYYDGKTVDEDGDGNERKEEEEEAHRLGLGRSPSVSCSVNGGGACADARVLDAQDGADFNTSSAAFRSWPLLCRILSKCWMDGTFIALVCGFVLMLLYTVAQSSRAWQDAHQMAVNVCMAVVCMMFVPAVAPFVRTCKEFDRAGGRLRHQVAVAFALVGDYCMLLATLSFAAVCVLMFLMDRGTPYQVALYVLECIGCYCFLVSALAYFASWVAGLPPARSAAAAPVGSINDGAAAALEDDGESGVAPLLQPEDPESDDPLQNEGSWLSRLLGAFSLDWWGHILNIAASLIYVLASTSGTLLYFSSPDAALGWGASWVAPPSASAGWVAASQSQTQLRQSMSQTFVIGDALWTADVAVFIAIWFREAVRREAKKHVTARAEDGDSGASP